MKFKTGVLLDSLQLPLSEAMAAVAEMTVETIQIFASSHHMSSGQLDMDSAKEIRKLMSGYKLELSALVGDLDGHGYERREENSGKIPRMKRIVDFANEVGTEIITTHIGVIPEDDDEKYSVMQEALSEICRYSEKSGIYIAVETGPEKAAVLKRFIEDSGESHLKVNFDPANIVMVQGEDVIQAVETLKDHIIHTHAKDGRMISPCNPLQIYNAFAEGNPENLNYDDFFVELPLGAGNVDFPAYLKALEQTGYSGSLTIEREAGESRLKDIEDGVIFLKEIISNSNL